MLGDGAELLNERWHGDPRALRDEAGGETQKITPLLEEFPGIGPSGAGIFLREVQAVWPSVAPWARSSMFPLSGAWTPKMVIDIMHRPMISDISANFSCPNPLPPSSGPRKAPHRPCAFTWS